MSQERIYPHSGSKGMVWRFGYESLTTHICKWIRDLCPNLGCGSNPWI